MVPSVNAGLELKREQVNLRFITDEKGMQQLRRMLSAAAQRAAKGWTFQPPSRGESAQDPFWTVRVPVAFAMQGARAVTPYGQWESYIPGPRQRAPWEQVNEGLAFTPDALPDGGVYQAGQGLRLVTPPGG